MVENIGNGKIEDVIFLGAGASAAEGAPLTKDLFKEYFKCIKGQSYERFYKRRYGKEPEQLKEMNQRLVKFFKDFFGINAAKEDLDKVLFPTFEEALGLLELALNREESFRQHGSISHVRQIREDLIFLIAIVLEIKLRGENKHHKKLIERLDNKNTLYKTAFISSNYDILIDNALLQVYDKYHLDNGVEFTNYEEKDNPFDRPEPEKAVHLYKLHGSLNWLYCPTCVSLTYYLDEKKVSKLIFKPEHCNICHSEMIPVIIPPSFFKVMSNYYLQQIWRKTEKALIQAKRIFFCGYSFSDADMHIKYLFKRVEMNKQCTPEIYVINNPEKKSDDEKSDDENGVEESRYRRFFKQSKKVRYTDESFQMFCKKDLLD